MDLRQLSYFVAVAEERHVSRAAERLMVAQPWLSQQIKALERELGATLFDRSSRPLALTDAGRRLLVSATRVFAELETGRDAVRRAAQGLTGELHLGFTYGGLYDLLAPALARFAAERPDVAVHLHQLAAAEQVPALRQRRVDVLVSRLTEPVTGQDLRVEPVRREFLIALVREDHPAAARGTIGLAELDGEPLVLVPRAREPLIHDGYLAACRSAGFEPVLAPYVEDAQTQALTIASGRGVALSGDGLSLRFPGIAYLQVEPATVLTSVAALHLAATANPVVGTFLAALPAAR